MSWWRLPASAARTLQSAASLSAASALCLSAPTERAWVAASARTSASACWAASATRPSSATCACGGRGIGQGGDEPPRLFVRVARFVQILTRLGEAFGEAGTAEVEPLDLDPGAILGTARFPDRRRGLGLGCAGPSRRPRGPSPSRRSPPAVRAWADSTAAAAAGSAFSISASRLTRISRSAAAAPRPDGDEAVPAAKTAVASDQALADRKRRFRRRCSTTPTCSSRRRKAAGAWTCAASGSQPAGSGGSPARRLRPGPASRRIAVEGRVEIVAQAPRRSARSNPGSALTWLIARSPLVPSTALISALASEFERGERGPGGGSLAFGRVARRRGLLAASLGGGDRVAGSFETGFRRLAPRRAAVRSDSTSGASSPSPDICSSSRRLSASARPSFASAASSAARATRASACSAAWTARALPSSASASRALSSSSTVRTSIVPRAASAAASRAAMSRPSCSSRASAASASLPSAASRSRSPSRAVRRSGELAKPSRDAFALGPQGRQLVAQRSGPVAGRLGGRAALGERLAPPRPARPPRRAAPPTPSRPRPTAASASRFAASAAAAASRQRAKIIRPSATLIWSESLR